MTRLRAFTLIEILLVIAIVLILLSLVLPAMRSVLESYQLRQAGSRIAAMIEEARIEAVTMQKVTAVRFIQGSKETEFSSVGIVRITFDPSNPADPGGNKEVLHGRLFRLPEPVIIDAPRSSIFEADSGIVSKTVDAAPAAEAGKTCRDFYLFPNGTTSLNARSPNPHLCLMTRPDALRSDAEIRNPLVISIDPVTSRLTIYQR